MKKFLSLVLSLALAMSLVTVSAGATDFDDDGDITYQEAVTVIAGLGIVDGYSDGTFGPDEALTRGAAAKIICNLILGPTTADALSASSAPFVDVPTTNTFAGYITYCSQQGIISGYADGTFRPTGTLSGNAFMKMLLGALGYDSEKEGYTGSNWTVNVIKQAVGIGLEDGNDDFVGSQAVTRQEACLYAFNTLQATMVEYSDNSVVTVGDITISSQGEYSDVSNGTSTDGNIEDDELMQFAERYFEDLEAEDDTDDFGRPATNWVYDGDDLGTYANDADATCVVADAAQSLSELMTDSSYLNYDSDEILDDAVVYYNGMSVDGDDSFYEDLEDDPALAGKGDIIEAFENDDGDVDTIVIRSYTYAMIDAVDEDLSSSQQSDGASVGLDLVDIDGDSLGNGTYFDDYDDSEYVLNGWNSDYAEGTAIAVALGEDSAILDSYVMETVTGTPTAARDVDDYTYTNANISEGLGNSYQGDNRGVQNGHITIDGTRYTYAAQFTGLKEGDEVDFDEEYTVYLTAEGYALAVDGDAAVSLKDVYFVVGLYAEANRGSTSYYAQAISVSDGVEHTLRLDYEDDADGGDTAAEKIAEAFGVEDEPSTSEYVTVRDLYNLDEDSNKYKVEGTAPWRGNTTYEVAYDELYDDEVTSGDSVIRFSDDDGATVSERAYINDSTFFIGAEDTGDDLDISTATGMMSVKNGTGLKAFAIMDDNDAVFVIYAADTLTGATNKDDVVYMADDANNRNSSSTYLVDLYFLSDMTLEEDAVIDDDQDLQGFYTYSLSDDVYDLNKDADVLDEDNTEDGYAEFVVLNEGRNSVVSSVDGTDDPDSTDEEEAENAQDFAEAQSAVGSSVELFDEFPFDAYSISGATVIDTRSDSNRSNDLYSNTINTTSKLISALDRGWVVADLYVDDGDIIFVAVRECEDGESTSTPSANVTRAVANALTDIEDALEGETFELSSVSAAAVRTAIAEAADAAIDKADGVTYTVTATLGSYTPDTTVGASQTVLVTVTVRAASGSDNDSDSTSVSVTIDTVAEEEEEEEQSYSVTGSLTTTNYENWNVTSSLPTSLKVGDEFDVVVTRSENGNYTAFDQFTWEVTADNAVFSCDAELTTAGDASTQAQVTITVTVTSVTGTVSNWACTISSVAD